jgi:predicted dehydrogenase
MESHSKVRVGIVGVGKMGLFHLKKFQALECAHLVGFYEPNAARAQSVMQESGVSAFSELSDLFFETDAVVIACPTPQHAGVARLALEAGLHVLIEKPIAESANDALALAELAQSKQLVLQVGMVERFRLDRLLPYPIERPVWIEAHRLTDRLGREPSSIDVIDDLMIHDLDLALSFFPGEPIHVSAVGWKTVTPRTDIAHARLEFSCGAIVNLTASRIASEVTRKLRFYSAAGYCSLDFNSGLVKTVRLKSASEWERVEQVVPPLDPLLTQAQDFLESIRLGHRPKVDGFSAVRVLRVAERISLAIAERAEKALGVHELPNQEQNWRTTSSS